LLQDEINERTAIAEPQHFTLLESLIKGTSIVAALAAEAT
jgi:hypothetical protein